MPYTVEYVVLYTSHRRGYKSPKKALFYGLASLFFIEGSAGIEIIDRGLSRSSSSRSGGRKKDYSDNNEERGML